MVHISLPSVKYIATVGRGKRQEGTLQKNYTSVEVTIQSFQYQRPSINITASIFNKCSFDQPLFQQTLSDT